MLTIEQINRLLYLNKLLTVRALRSTAPDASTRLHQLSVHRTVLKDCLIELLSIELTQANAA